MKTLIWKHKNIKTDSNVSVCHRLFFLAKFTNEFEVVKNLWAIILFVTLSGFWAFKENTIRLIYKCCKQFTEIYHQVIQK